jgi:hypothetical protein
MYAKPGAKGRVTKRHVATLVELGLLEELVSRRGRERVAAGP